MVEHSLLPSHFCLLIIWNMKCICYVIHQAEVPDAVEEVMHSLLPSSRLRRALIYVCFSLDCFKKFTLT